MSCPPNLFLCGTPIKAYLMQSIDAESCTLHSSGLVKSDLLLTNAIDSHQLIFSNVNWKHYTFLSTAYFQIKVKIIESEGLSSTVDLFLISKNQFGKIKFTVWVACKDQFQIDFRRLKIQFAELDFSKLIFQKSSTYQQGDSIF